MEPEWNASLTGPGLGLGASPIRGLMMDVNLTQKEAMDAIIAGFSEEQFRLHEPRFILLVVCYAPLFIVAVTANTVVIAVFFKFHYMRSITNYFLVNLSIADLLVTFICMPAAVSQSITGLWIYGESICKLTSYFQCVSVAASVFTITAMSIDRYLLIKNSMAFRRVFNRKSTVYIIAILWVVALVIFMPILWVRRLKSIDAEGNPEVEAAFRKHGLVWCIEDWGQRKNSEYNSKHIYGVLCFVIVYATPGSVVISAYSLMGRQLWVVTPPFDRHESTASIQQQRVIKERRRAARILLLLAILFALCWLPYNVINLMLDLDIRWQERTMLNWYPFALLLGHANSAINPLLYCVMTKNLRKTVRKLFRQEFDDIHTGRRRCFKVSDTKYQLFERIRLIPWAASAVLHAGNAPSEQHPADTGQCHHLDECNGRCQHTQHQWRQPQLQPQVRSLFHPYITLQI
ncbi:unnamed protein product [Bemisia tabaci]|uniref:Uncharacterized protein n=1 Tax=Bemisia tabaci TaxID=7038 RepID=A0A9P0F302_BEMTA|nr:unnamed protein product [Bemisia tabaci]